MSARIDFLERSKFYGIVLVVLGHVLIVGPQDEVKLYWPQAVSSFIYTFHMKLFFVIAGILFFRKIDNYLVNAQGYFVKQLIRFALPFVAINILYSVTYHIYSKIIFSYPEYVKWLCGGGRYGQNMFLFIGGSWFLASMLFVKSFSIVIYKISSTFFSSRKVYKGLAFALLFCVGLIFTRMTVLQDLIGKKFPFDWNIEYYLIWFNISFILYFFDIVLINSVEDSFNKSVPILIIGVLFLIGIIAGTATKKDFIYPMIIIIFIIMLGHLNIGFFDRFIIWAAKLGMAMYLLHFFVIDFVWQPLYIKYFSGIALGRGYAYFPTAFIFVYAVTLALSYVASRNSKINLLLFGDKGRIVNT